MAPRFDEEEEIPTIHTHDDVDDDDDDDDNPKPKSKRTPSKRATNPIPSKRPKIVIENKRKENDLVKPDPSTKKRKKK